MTRFSILTFIHIFSAFCGIALCALNFEGPGVLVFCVSVLFLILARVDSMLDPNFEDAEPGTTEARLDSAQQTISRCGRRAAAIVALLGHPEAGHVRNFRDRVGRLLQHIDQDDDSVDIALQELRDDVLSISCGPEKTMVRPHRAFD